MGEFNLLRGAKDEEVKIEGAATLVGCVDDGFALRGEGWIIVVNTFMRSLEEAATITVNHADLVIVSARAGEDEPPAVNAGRVGERGMRGWWERRVGRWESGFDGQPDGYRKFGRRCFWNEKKWHGEKPQEDDPEREAFFLFRREDCLAMF